MEINKIFHGDAITFLSQLDDQSINCIVTSPPYFGLRDYGLPPLQWPAVKYTLFGPEITVPEMSCCMGLELTPEAFIGHLVLIFRIAREKLRDDGTLWLNIGDSYAASGRGGGGGSFQDNDIGTRVSDQNNRRQPVEGLKPKDLIGIPWMLAFALRADGWYLRQDIIWHKPNPMPESVTDRCTKSHEYIFLLSKSQRYYYDQESIMQNVTLSSVARLQQDIENQQGSDRVPGKTNGTMKAKASWNGSSFDVGKTGEMKTTHGHRKSGNKSRKPGSARGLPSNGVGSDLVSGNVAGSVPWEGMKANKRSVWTVTTKPFKEAHFATFPEELIVDCIKAGCPIDGIVCDMFAGAGTTPLVARKLNRNFYAGEPSAEYLKIAERRMHAELGLFV